MNRRTAIRSLFGASSLLPAVLSDLSAATESANPLAPRAPHFPSKAKRVIFLYLTGGASHVDSFDYKPKLIADHGKTVTGGRNGKGHLYAPKWEFKPRGQSGLMISDLFPHIASCADDICLIRSMRNDHNDHFEATLGIHTGSITFARPSFGAWISYGLGTENQNLPSFVVLAPELPYAGGQNWSSDFLPGCHQGTRIVPGSEPIPNMHRRAVSPELQQLELGLLDFFNKRHQAPRADDPALAARIKSFETAYGMQMEAPDIFDFSREPDSVLNMYGLERGSTKGFAWQCLAARRMAERGVRFIELIDTGASRNWDAHGDIDTHVPLAKNVDQPVAALLKDLKSRGMLEETLVVFTTEFGRTPFRVDEKNKGREHHCYAFSSWIAGAGVRPGVSYGESDDYGISVAKDEVHLHDFHATLLHLLGFEHTRLTFRHAGRDYRLTDIAGKVIPGLLA